MSTRVRFDVPILRSGSAPLMLDVEADVVVDDHVGLTRVVVKSLRFGDWEWARPGVDGVSFFDAALAIRSVVYLEGLGLSDWERDYLRELALLAFRHSRLAWSGARVGDHDR